MAAGLSFSCTPYVVVSPELAMRQAHREVRAAFRSRDATLKAALAGSLDCSTVHADFPSGQHDAFDRDLRPRRKTAILRCVQARGGGGVVEPNLHRGGARAPRKCRER